MADVLLRDLIEQLRGLIHAGNHADAFALGEHILHSFPKHVETYTLLAQACLEVNDTASATDLFRRVLSADPENVIALAGMALLNESHDKTDEALWYLERAYEVQPGNDDLRHELLRVRETFYGAPTTRLELTAGALARVYARQGQYAHAVNEYRRLLRNDSKRYDARVGLAETLFLAGRNDEAAQLAQSIMADAPFALKPNLILGYLWSENDVPEGQQFLKRAQQLDPEHRAARQLLGERFKHGEPPRLPALGERAFSPELDDHEIGSYSPGAFQEADNAHAIEFLRELDRAQEPEPEEDEPLFAELDALSLVESLPLSPAPSPAPAEPAGAPAASVDTVPGLPAAPSAPTPAPLPMELVDAAPEPSSESDPAIAARLFALTGTAPAAAPAATDSPASSGTAESPAPPEKKTSDFASRVARRSGERLSPDAIAAAANALAASIALDKTNQPTPSRRTHPAIPKVRPVIRGVAERIPTWLRLGSTPAAASATFDLTPPGSTDTITPLKTPAPNHPDWLIEAQAAAERTSTAPAAENELPDWLKGHEISAEPVKPVPAPPADMPTWLQDATTAAASAPPVESAPPASVGNTGTLPDWLKGHEIPAEPANVAPPSGADVVPPFDAVSTAEDDAPAFPSAPDGDRTVFAAPARTPEPPAAPSAPIQEASGGTGEERGRGQAMPDSATMLQMAREKRAGGDWKGAMELYERVMHRRPNYLDQIIGDLQEVVRTDAVPPGANRLLGEAYAMAGRFKESLEQYRIAMGK